LASARRVLEKNFRFPFLLSKAMSHRAHFWLRAAAVAVILFAEFGPRVRSAPSASSAPVVVATDAR